MKAVLIVVFLTFFLADGHLIHRSERIYALLQQARRDANGCGSGSLTINALLGAVGGGVVVSCCNTHDTCYETCGQSKSVCDSAFRQCLQNQCNTLTGSFQWLAKTRIAICKLDGVILYSAVHVFGQSPYQTAQVASGCSTSNGGNNGHGGNNGNGGNNSDGGDGTSETSETSESEGTSETSESQGTGETSESEGTGETSESEGSDGGDYK